MVKLVQKLKTNKALTQQKRMKRILDNPRKLKSAAKGAVKLQRRLAGLK